MKYRKSKLQERERNEEAYEAVIQLLRRIETMQVAEEDEGKREDTKVQVVSEDPRRVVAAARGIKVEVAEDDDGEGS